MHYRKKHPTKVKGNRCGMCQWEKMLGNVKLNLKPSDRRRLEGKGLPDASHR